MQNSLWTITGFRRTTFAAFATAGLIIATLPSAQAQDAPSSYAAPLDMGWSTYADYIEFPEFLPNAPAPRAFAGRETTGVNTTPEAPDGVDATASTLESKHTAV